MQLPASVLKTALSVNEMVKESTFEDVDVHFVVGKRCRDYAKINFGSMSSISDIENMIYEIRHQHITSFAGRYPTVQCIHIDDPSITERFAKELSADRQLEMALTHVFSGKKLFVYAIYTKRGDNYEIVLSNEFKSEYCCSDHSSSRTITKHKQLV